MAEHNWINWILEVSKLYKVKQRLGSLRDRFKATGLESFLIGFALAFLLLKTVMIPRTVTQVFIGALIVILAIWFFIRESSDNRFRSDHAQRGLFIFLALGYAAGTLLYLYRDRVKWLWAQLASADTDTGKLLAALFAFGMIMGVYVVRNWSKGQEEFTKSVVATVGGALLTPLLGKLEPGTIPTFRAFIFYFSGFVLSAGVNLIYASRLVASYTNKRSLESRALLSFLYGPDKPEDIDAQFLKNFKKDPDDARRLLFEALSEYKKRIRQEYAQKMQLRCDQKREDLDYYELISIEGASDEAGSADEVLSSPQFSPPLTSPPLAPDGSYMVNYRRILPTDESTNPTSLPELAVNHDGVARKSKVTITPDMFRIRISVSWQDHLEYIAEGDRWKTFPKFGSVAGLALEARRTIVMDRDKLVKFRTPDYLDGLTPGKIEQKRGTNQIAFLSYIAIPAVIEMNNFEYTPLGIIHVDTKLFAAIKGDFSFGLDSSPGDHKVRIKLDDLTKLACNLYDHDDEGIKYLEETRSVVVPLLTLYLKCRQGTS